MYGKAPERTLVLGADGTGQKRSRVGSAPAARKASAVKTSRKAEAKSGSRSRSKNRRPGDAVTQVHDEVAGLLHDPCSGWVCGHSGQGQFPGAVLDGDQHVQPFEHYRLGHEEVARAAGTPKRSRSRRAYMMALTISRRS